MIVQHNLKILPKYFSSVIDGRKKFELRSYDRDYRVNDLVKLNEFDGNDYTGNFIIVKITYVLSGVPQYGLNEDYCIFSFDIIESHLEPLPD